MNGWILLATTVLLAGCHSENKKSLNRAVCMKGLIGDPMSAARSDVKQGVVHLYSRFDYGFSAGYHTPGVDNCPSFVLDPDKDNALVSLGNVPWKKFDVSIDEDKTRALSHRETDAPIVLSECGVEQVKYLWSYNIEVIRLQPRVIRKYCKSAHTFLLS